jgi:hypothetical protein
MSNHDGSYMLNKVLLLLEKYSFFDCLSQDKISEFVNDIVEIGGEHDCNDGEIFNKIGKRLKYCYYCKNFSTEIDDSSLCQECR